jgi:sodium/potassium/calcium exchanger 6
MMGFSACFGGPMLNILMGIGGSGSYIIHANGGEPYILHFSTTLMVSTIGLLFLLGITLVFVPWNGFYLPRKWGFFLVMCYFIIMSTNVAVEVRRHQSTV